MEDGCWEQIRFVVLYQEGDEHVVRCLYTTASKLPHGCTHTRMLTARST